jgi:hypothetical protein
MYEKSTTFFGHVVNLQSNSKNFVNFDESSSQVDVKIQSFKQIKKNRCGLCAFIETSKLKYVWRPVKTLTVECFQE